MAQKTDAEPLRALAHALRGSAATASASALADCAGDLERAAGRPEAQAAAAAVGTTLAATLDEWVRLGWLGALTRSRAL
jgi:HPt (histidine-containing phosphotransfer) domain-containing protein